VEVDVGLDPRGLDEDMALRAGGNVDPVGGEGQPGQLPGHGSLGEVEAHAGLIALDLPRAVIVDLEHEIRTGPDDPAGTVRGEPWRHAGRPAAEAGIGELEAARPGPSREAGFRVGALAPARVAGVVEMNAAMVDDPAVAGAELEAVDCHLAI